MAKVVVFDNGSFVDTENNGFRSESDNVQAWFAAKGHAVTTFTGVTAAAITAALTGKDILVLPEFEIATPSLSADARTAIANWVAGGGTIIINGGSGDQPGFLNSIFGWSLSTSTSGSPSGTFINAAGTAGTAFSGGPSSIPNNNGTEFLTAGSLPSGSRVMYASGSNVSVAAMPWGSGEVVYMGWDWFNGTPIGSQNGGWDAVMERAVTYGLQTAAPGANVAPTVSAFTSGEVTEDSANPTLTAAGTITFDDANQSDTHTVTVEAVSGNPLGGTLSASITTAATGPGAGIVSWNYSLANASAQQLAVGRSVIETFNVRITDNNGVSVDRPITVIVNGANDPPTVSAVTNGTVTEDTSPTTLSTAGTITFDDVDVTNGHRIQSVEPVSNELGGSLSASVTTPATGAGAGTVGWSYSVANAATQYLAAGESVTETFEVRIMDNAGVAVDQMVTITIVGTNDAPTISAFTNGSVTEDSGTPNLSATGTITFDDVDLSDMHAVSVAASGANALGGTLSPVLTTPATGEGAGTVTWTYSVPNAATQFLAAGQQTTESFTVSISDGKGGTVSQLITVTINGTNDAPVISGTAVSAAFTETDTTLTDTGALNVVDVDLSNTVTMTVDGVSVDSSSTFSGTNPLTPAELVAMMSVTGGTLAADPTAGSPFNWTFTSGDSGNQAFNFLPAGETLVLNYTIKATDNSATPGAGTQTVTVTITGTNDVPVITTTANPTVEVQEGTGALVGGAPLLDVNATDVDAGSVLTYSFLNGTDGESGFQVSADGRFTIDKATGVVTVTPGAGPLFDFEQSPTASFTVVAADNGNPALSTQQSYTVQVANVTNETFTFPAGKPPVTLLGGGDNLTLNFTTGADGTDTAPASVRPGEGSDAGFTLIDVDGDGTPDFRVKDFSSVAINMLGGNDEVAAQLGGPKLIIDAGENSGDYDVVKLTTTAAADSVLFRQKAGAPNILEVVVDNVVQAEITNAERVAVTTGNGDVVVKVVGDTGATGVATNTMVFTGGAGADLLDASGETGATSYEIYGLGGNDTLIGSKNNDTLDGGADIDTIDFSAIPAIPAGNGLVLKLDTDNNSGNGVIGFANGAGSGSDLVLRDIENAIGTQANDAISGSAEANRLDGQGGDDEIFGNDGDDTIAGGAGFDKIAGEAGTDTAVLVGELAGASNASPTVVNLADGQATQTLGVLKLINGLATANGADEIQTVENLRFTGADGLENTADDVVIEVDATGNAVVYAIADTNTATEDAAGSISGDVTANDINLDEGGLDQETIVGVAAGTPSGPVTGSVGVAVTGTYGDLTVHSTGNYTYTLNNALASVQQLGQGDTATDTFTYAVDDGSGNPRNTTVTITVVGVNDAAVITGVSAIAAIPESTGNSTNQDIAAQAVTVTATDADVGDSMSVSVLGSTVSLNGNPFVLPPGANTLNALGNLSFATGTSNGGTISLAGNYNPGPVNLDWLAVGDTLTVTYTVAVNDGVALSAPSTVTVTITGTNDVPVINANLVINGSFENPDVNNQFFGSPSPIPGWVTNGGSSGTEIVDNNYNGVLAADGDQWLDTEGSPGGIDIQQALALEAGKTYTLTYQVANTPGSHPGTVLDVYMGGTLVNSINAAALAGPVGTYTTFTHTFTAGSTPASNTLRFDGAGVPSNVGFALDAVSVVEAPPIPAALLETTDTGDNTAQTTSVTVKFTDADLAEGPAKYTPTVDSVTLTNSNGAIPLPVNATAAAWLTPGAVTKAPGQTAGTATFAFSAPESAFDYLAAGETLTLAYTVTIADADGGSATDTVRIQVTGTNDRPEINAQNPSPLNLTETTDTGDSTPQTASVTLAFSDVDLSQTAYTGSVISVSAVNSNGTIPVPVNSTALGWLTPGVASKTAGTSTGNATFGFSAPESAFDYLAAGETLTLTYTVGVSDGALADTETVTIVVTGTNDVPNIAAQVPTPEPLLETPAVTDGLALQTTSVTLTFGDADLSQSTPDYTPTVESVTVTGPAGSPATAVAQTWLTPGAISKTAGSASGTAAFNFSAVQSALDFLAAGETLTLAYQVKIADAAGGSDTETVTIRITGTNDAPTISTFTNGNVTEDATNPSLSTTGTITFDDVDLSDAHTASVTPVSNALGGTLTASITADPATGPGNGTVDWSYSVANAATQYLAVGETTTETFTVSINDGNGGTVSQLITVTITGTNDAPTISTFTNGNVTEDATNPTLSTTGTITFDDVDLIDTHTTSVTPVSNALGGTLTASITVDPATGPGNGTVDWSYSVPNAATQYLAVGETTTETFTVTINDGNGGTVSQLITVTITGTNDAPTISTHTDGGVTEDATNPTLSTTGTITFDDVDLIDTHTTSVVASGSNTLGGTLTASVTDTATGAGDGTVTWSYSVPNAATQYLAAGQTVTEDFTVTISDGNGGTVSEVITVTITGTNDAPVIRTNLLTDGDFEATNLTPGAPGVSSNGLGSWITVPSFGAWTVTGTGGAFNPANPPISNNNTNVAWLTAGATLEQSIGSVPGNQTMQFSVKLGNRTDQAGATGFLKVIDTVSGNVLASQAFDTNTILPDGTFSTTPVTVTTPVFVSTSTIKVVVENASGGQVLVDDAVLATVQPSLLTETDAPLSITGMLNVVDVDTADLVALSVDSAAVAVGGTGASVVPASLNDAALKAMFSVNPATPATVPADAIGGSNFSWTFNSAPEAFNFLAAGQTLTLTYTVKATDNTLAPTPGADTETVTITITGTNDLPVITGGPAVGAVADVSETAAQDPSLSTGALTQSGSIAFTDADVADTGHTANLVSTVPTGTTTGFAGNAAAYLTLTPSNSATAADGTLAWSFSAPESDFDYLNDGETLTLTYTVSVSDAVGASNTQTITITVTGANDAPVITSGPQTASLTEAEELAIAPPSANAGNLTASDTLNFTDVDITDAGHTPTVTVAATGVTAGFDATAAAGFFSTVVTNTATLADGTIAWTFDAPETAFDYLADGEQLVLTYTVKVSDEALDSNTRTVTITINGKNDNPTIDSIASTGTATEAGTPNLSDSPASVLPNTATAADFLTAGTPVTATGQFNFFDLDLTDTHSIVDANGAAAGNAAIVSGAWARTLTGETGLSTVTLSAAQIANIGSLTASVTNPATGDGAGVVSWTYTASEGSLDFLAAGETLTLVYEVTVKDDSGVSANDTITKQVQVTITGANDAPVITSAPFTPAFTEANDTGNFVNRYNEQGTIQFTDVDVSQRNFTYSLDPVIGVVANGAHTPYVGPTPSQAQLASYFSVGSFGPVIIPDAAGGIAANNTGTSTDPQTLTTGVDGSFGWRFRAEHDDFDFLNDGETLTLTYKVRVTDALGAYDEQDVVLTITGRNELIVGTGFDDVINQADSSSPIALTTQFGDDIDAGDGDDFVIAAAGPDDIVAGLGNDTVDAGTGDDFIIGDVGNVGSLAEASGDANDTVGGDDVLSGGAGNDTIYGQGGDDEIDGGSGNDSLLGGAGDDVIVGGSGNDWIDGGAGADTINGGTGDDVIVAGDGDVIDGGSNTDVIVVKGSWIDYDIRANGDGSVTLTGRTATAVAGETVTVRNVEKLDFADDGQAAYDLSVAVDDRPVIAGLDNSTVLENSANGVVVDSFSVSDLDLGILQHAESLTVTLLNDSTLPFTVQPGSTLGSYDIVVDGALDRETLSSYTLVIEVKDAKGATATQSITVAIGDQNDNAPVITNANTLAVVPENGGSMPLFSVTATDRDITGGPIAYSIDSTFGDHAKFAINATTGVLTFLGADFEGASVSGDDIYNVKVIASDGTNSSSQQFDVDVRNVNEAPSIAAPAVPLTSMEDATVTITNAQLQALVTDPEFNDSPSNGAVTLSVIVTTAAGVPVFSQSGYDLGAGGAVSFTPPKDYEGVLNVTLTAVDSGGLSTSRTVPVTITQVNDAPVITSLPQVGAVIEDGQAGAETVASGTLAASDVDGPAVSWQYFDGAAWVAAPAGSIASPYGSFTLDAATGAWTFTLDNTLATTDGLGAEGNLLGQTMLQVRATDGTLFSAPTAIVVGIGGTNDAPRQGTLPTVTMQEDAAATSINILSSFTDPEGKPLSIASAESANGTVSIDGGNVVFTPAANYNGPATITFAVTDGDRVTTSTLSFAIDSVNDAPVLISGIEDRSVSENMAFTFTVPAATFADVDAGQTLTLSAALAGGGALPAWLSFDAATGTFTGTPPTNYAGGPVTVRVTATDDGPGALSVFDDFVLSVNLANDAPVVPTIAAVATDEDAAPVVLKLLAGVTDPDGPSAPTVASFEVTASNGKTVAASLDPATGDLTIDPAQYNSLKIGEDVTLTVTYAITDGEAVVEKTTTVTVAGVNDAPVFGAALNSQVEVFQGTVGARGLTVGTFTATDADGEALTFTVSDTRFEVVPTIAAGAFELKAKAGAVFTAFDTALSLTVNANDGHVTVPKTFNLGDALAPNATFSVTENLPANTVVGTVVAPNGLTNPSFALSTANNDFSINATTGEITTLRPLDFEAVSQYIFDVVITGDQGSINDTQLINVQDQQSVFNGDANPNIINGTALEDSLFGLGANDTLNGGAGDDMLYGGTGDDVINGGAGADLIDGGTGALDLVSYAGSAAPVTVNLSTQSATGGDATGDTIVGIEGAIGSSGSDTMFGSANADLFVLGGGSDFANGLGGNDTIYGDAGQDTILGDAGQDILLGGADNDVLYGGVDDDQLYGDAGNDVLLGEAGNDTLFDGDGLDTLSGGAGNDTLVSGNGDDVLLGDDGNDVLYAGAGFDYLVGGQGNDVLFASSLGTSQIYGGEGNDIVYGASNRDYMQGDAGDDVLFGFDGADTLVGGSGADGLSGGAGSDYLVGGAGADGFYFLDNINGGDVDQVGDFEAGVDMIYLTQAMRGSLTIGDSAIGAYISANTGSGIWAVYFSGATASQIQSQIVYI